MKETKVFFVDDGQCRRRRVVAELVKSDGRGELSPAPGVRLMPPTGAFAIGPPGCQAGGNDAARSSTGGASQEK